VKARFFVETSRRGVLFAPNHQWFVSAAHTDEDLELTVEACRRAAAFATAG
jgi:glutamate-1-semialdehyde 2,1-aminomutase